MARRLLLDACRCGLPVGTEFLDLLSPQFISDLVTWGAIGARTTEPEPSPTGQRPVVPGRLQERHRRQRQGSLPTPCSRRASHAFMGMTKMGQAAVFETRGNRDCHVILRGGKQPNYDTASVQAACDALNAAKLRPR